MRFLKIIKWFERVFKTNYITLRRCKHYNCQYNHAEVCFLREYIDRTDYCEILQDTNLKLEGD